MPPSSSNHATVPKKECPLIVKQLNGALSNTKCEGAVDGDQRGLQLAIYLVMSCLRGQHKDLECPLAIKTSFVPLITAVRFGKQALFSDDTTEDYNPIRSQFPN